MPVAEGHGCGHSEPSLEITVELACHIFRLGNIRQNSACALVIGKFRLGEAQPPRGSVEHAGAETTFKRKNPAANNGFCYAELLRRAGEASHLHRADEDRHVIEDAHERTIFRNEATEVKSSVVETTASIPINPSITRRYVSQCCCICPDSPSASSKETT